MTGDDGSDTDPLIQKNDNSTADYNPDLDNIFINEEIQQNRSLCSQVISFVYLKLRVVLSTRYVIGR